MLLVITAMTEAHSFMIINVETVQFYTSRLHTREAVQKKTIIYIIHV